MFLQALEELKNADPQYELEFINPLFERLQVLCLVANKRLTVSDKSSKASLEAAEVKDWSNEDLAADWQARTKSKGSVPEAGAAVAAVHSPEAPDQLSVQGTAQCLPSLPDNPQAREQFLAEHLTVIMNERFDALGPLLPVEDPKKITPLKLMSMDAVKMTTVASAEELEVMCSQWEARKSSVNQLVQALRKSTRHLKAEQARRSMDKKNISKRENKAQKAQEKKAARKQQADAAAVQQQVSEKVPLFLQTVLDVLTGPMQPTLTTFQSEEALLAARERAGEDVSVDLHPWVVRSSAMQTMLQEPEEGSQNQDMKQHLSKQLKDFAQSFPKSPVAKAQGCCQASLTVKAHLDEMEALFGNFTKVAAASRLELATLAGYTLDSRSATFFEPSIHMVINYQHQGRQHIVLVSYMEFREYLHTRNLCGPQLSPSDAVCQLQLLSKELLEGLLAYGAPVFYFEVGPGCLWSIPTGYLCVITNINSEHSCALQSHIFCAYAELASFYRTLACACPENSSVAEELKGKADECSAH